MQVRLMPSCGVCLSVTFVNSVKTSNHIFKNFLPLGSQTIPVFPYQTSWLGPPNAASNAGEVGTNCDSGQIAGYRSMAVGAIVRSIPDKSSSFITPEGSKIWHKSSVQWCITVGPTVHVRLRHRDRHASMNMPKIRESNRIIYLYAAVNLKPK